MDKKKIEAYEEIGNAVGEMTALNAIGILKPTIVEWVKEVEMGNYINAYKIAALLRLIQSALREIEIDALSEEERRLLSGNFIKSLEGIRWILFGADGLDSE